MVGRRERESNEETEGWLKGLLYSSNEEERFRSNGEELVD